MTILKASLASFPLLAAALAVAPSAFAQDIVNIANVRGAQESTYFASVRGWKVVVGAVNGRPAYCAAIKDQGGSELRIGYGSEQWQVGIPYSAKRGEFVGSMELDGNVSGTAGVSDGKWTFLWLNLGERDALMNGQQVIFEVGKASMDYELSGTSAAIQKVEECVERRLSGGAVVAGGGGGNQPNTGANPPRFKPVNQPASPAAAAPGGGFAKPYGKVGGWEIVRITKDAGGKRFDHCAAWIITDSETGLRIAITNNDTSFGFSGLGSAAMGNVAPLSVWFDKDKSSASSLEGALVPDHNGFEWMMITESNSEPGLFSDSIPNASTIHFGYPVDGKGHTQTFSLKGTNAVVNKLIDCRDGR
jgi:hypothetical protein